MAQKAWIRRELLTPPDEEPVGAPPPRRIGVALMAVGALLVSGALSWWVAQPNPAADVAAAPPSPEPAPRARPAPVRYAAADPDPGQVRQALADVQQGYADGGPEGLLQGSAGCARDLPLDPRRLDYCLAYDVYAAQIAPPDAGPAVLDWFHGAPDRDLALARAALPGSVDAANRLVQVDELTRAVLPKAPPKAGPPAVRVAEALPKPPVALHAKGPGAPKTLRAKTTRAKAVRSRPPRNFSDPYWRPPEPSTLDEQYAREAAAEAQLDREISQGLVDPPH